MGSPVQHSPRNLVLRCKKTYSGKLSVLNRLIILALVALIKQKKFCIPLMKLTEILAGTNQINFVITIFINIARIPRSMLISISKDIIAHCLLNSDAEFFHFKLKLAAIVIFLYVTDCALLVNRESRMKFTSSANVHIILKTEKYFSKKPRMNMQILLISMFLISLYSSCRTCKKR